MGLATDMGETDDEAERDDLDKTQDMDNMDTGLPLNRATDRGIDLKEEFWASL